MNDQNLLDELEWVRTTMIAVATGGPRIATVNDEFRARYGAIAAELASRGMINPLPFHDLWNWYGRWGSGDMPTWQSRREFVNGLIEPLALMISTGEVHEYEPTGWHRVDRTVGRLREILASAETEEDFQTVGLFCRESLINVAQAVYDRNRHPPTDGVEPSETDAKRMLEAFIAVELRGRANEDARKHAKSALSLALALQHRRTADFRAAALCAEATTSVANSIAIISGRRDPEHSQSG